MDAIKISELITMLQSHMQKYGDDKVMLYDDYEIVYKTISKNNISKSHENRFVIECENSKA